jgi:hypothetical protein
LLLKKRNKLTVQARLQTAENIDLALLTLKCVVIFYVQVISVTVKKSVVGGGKVHTGGTLL